MTFKLLSEGQEDAASVKVEEGGWRLQSSQRESQGSKASRKVLRNREGVAPGEHLLMSGDILSSQGGGGAVPLASRG